MNYGSDGLDRMQVACENGDFNVDQGSPGCSSGTQLATYVFDKLQRVTTLQYGSGAPAASVSYLWKTWDDLGTLTHTLASSAGTSFADLYSPAHQILQSTIGNAAYQYASTASATTNYTPDGLNQYATVASQAIVYDANGNLTNDGKYTYTYDPENRLTAAVMTGMSASYLYDPAGRRHQKAVTGGTYAGTTQFLDSGDDEIAEYSVSGTTATLVRRNIPGRGVDQPIAVVTAAGVKTYFHQDKTGSVVAMSAVFTPASCSRRIVMICSSLNLEPFIVRTLPRCRALPIFGGGFGAQVTSDNLPLSDTLSPCHAAISSVEASRREDPAAAVHTNDEIGTCLIAGRSVEIDDQEGLPRKGAGVWREQDSMMGAQVARRYG